MMNLPAGARSERALDDLLELLRIPSVSRGAEHAPHVRRAARWLASRLTAAGVEGVRLLTAEADPPLVYGEWLHAPGAPTVLVYGHFDVQPAEPLDEWTTPPFEPQVRDGRVYGRGASDNKGTLLIPILAAEARLRASGRLPLNVKFLFEGEEEVGSGHLLAVLEQHRDLLACDLVLCTDAGRGGDDPPGLVTGTRGGCTVEVEVRGARTDLHSGIYGGAVQNPFQALATILAALRAPDGTVLVEGFYDRVRALSEAERAALRLPVDEDEFRAAVGVPALIGEPGHSLAERVGARPTLEVLRVWGEHAEPAITPIIPRVAYARISCRLVPDQEPAETARLVAGAINAVAPPGVTVTATPGARGSRPYVVPLDHPGNVLAAEVLTEVCGRPPYFSRLGGSVPVLRELHRVLGAHTVFMGFSRDDERHHAPDEFLRLESFTRGQVAYARLFDRLAAVEPAALRSHGDGNAGPPRRAEAPMSE